MSASNVTFEQLQKDFEQNLDRDLEKKELDFLHWLADKTPVEEFSAFTMYLYKGIVPCTPQA
ncbi:hypothetical protein [Jeotgalibacillus proteolyticus]|uniref:Uncharacterized protein n=1 Tax=Jeotgalibacillus proteolyticus TaxID=2082395 RepID=A0A2S5G9B3_9BACL|nr:hypothetical protein [Jeotgalibacillus proteolyticus]PPA69513.1 hypothetical protein C4B60_13245 [Jeotgalibacillus proteolyticus]